MLSRETILDRSQVTAHTGPVSSWAWLQVPYPLTIQGHGDAHPPVCLLQGVLRTPAWGGAMGRVRGRVTVRTQWLHGLKAGPGL